MNWRPRVERSTLRRLAFLGVGLLGLACGDGRRSGGSGPSNSSPTACRSGAPVSCSGQWRVQCLNGAPTVIEDCGASNQVCVATSTRVDAVCLIERPQGCSNAVRDGDETGVDCGGACTACFDEECSQHAHCVTNYCSMGRCAEPSCLDATKNGLETGVDCGGGCAPCPTGTACTTASDCQSGFCRDGSCAPPPASCSDGQKNGTESDLDCGGPSCPACALQDLCSVDRDCLSAFCNFGRCDRATCSDGIRNQGETDLDCGGPNCGDCADQSACLQETDCGSGRCEGGRCASCTDGIQSGSEAGVDCGGACSPCLDGAACSDASQCSGGRCEQNHCCTPNPCGFCGPIPNEICNGVDDDCDGLIDEGLAAGPLCANQQGACQGARSDCGGAAGWTCGPQTFARQSAYYAAAETPCDNVDNNCNNAVDEVSCPAPSNPCLAPRCTANGCGSTPVVNGTACPTAAPPPGHFSALAYCLNGVCTKAYAACACSAGTCTHSNAVQGPLSSRSVLDCGCGSQGISLQGHSLDGAQFYNVNGECLCMTANSQSGPWACFQ